MIHKTTRSILSVLLAALLLVTSTPLTPAFAGEVGAVPPQSESSESEGLKPAADGVYYISSAAELKEFANKVNDTSGQYTDIDAELTANIDLNNQPWYPIGSDSRPYTGTFNGNGKTISGLYLDSSSANYQGLFGYVGTGGTVKDLSVSGTVSGGMFVGGIVGYNNGGTVTGCTFSGSGSVSGNSYVGGVVGVVGDSSGTVKNCYNTGSVSGNSYVGGVVGSNSFSTVENCCNTGTVSGNSNYVGGVVGDSSGTVKNCYNTGSVSGSNVGGVVGWNSSGTVENCYNTGTVTGTYDYVGGVVGKNRASVTNCYNTGTVTVTGTYDFVGGVVGHSSGGSSASASVTNCYNTGSVSGSGWYVGGVVGYSSGGISASASVTNCYNTGTVTGTDDYVGGVVGYSSGGSSASVTNCYNTGSVKGNSYVGGVVGDNRGTVTGCYFLQTDGVPANGIGGGETTGATAVNDLNALCKALESNTTTWTIHPVLGRPVLNENKEGGLGTEASPYEISTAAQLKNFATAVNGSEKSAHAKLMNDIDLSSVCGESNSWTPIGNSEQNAYTGTFNGQNFEINGLNINSNTSDVYQGLFGYLSGGTVKNLTVEGSVNVTGNGGRVGGVVGYNYSGGNVTNCYNTVKVTGNDGRVGGVVGWNSGNVTNCYNTGGVKVTGNGGRGGGVVGYNNGNVKNCYNTGTVSGPDSGTSNYVGGVVGNNRGTVENCYNTGAVNSSGNYVGGVVGYSNGNVENCYYMQYTASTGVGSGGTATEKEKAAFQSGEVAWRLQNGQTELIWGQSALGTEDSLPTLNPTDEQKVYQVTLDYGDSFAEADDRYDYHYANANNTVTLPTSSDKIPSYEGHTLTGWQDADKNPVTGQTVTVTADTEFTALWQKDTVNYTITVSASPTAGGTVSGSGEYSEGTQVTVTATPATGYHFVKWTENGTQVSTSDTYSFTATANRTLTANFAADAVDPDPTPTPTPDPEPTGPSTGDSTGWADILDELENAENGDQITIDMGDETEVPAEIFATIAGKDVDVIFDLGDVQWSASGENIPTDTDFTDLDLGVALGTSGIPVNVINAITGEVGTVQITLAHNGEFGFTMTLTAPLGKENAGYWANLYHYDEEAEALNFETAAKIDETGSVTIPFSHASQYAIVIDTHSHATVDVSDIFLDVAPNAWYKDAIQYAYDNGLMTGVSDTEFAPEQTTTRAMIVSILARLEGVESAQAAGFADVDDNDWYATAVNWAANVGVVNGYEDNTFKPNTAITREQLAAILMNYAAYKGEDVSNRADLTSYTDQPSTWAEEAISWSVAEGLLTGVTADTLQPQGAATRAQVAAILQRFLSE